MVKVRSPNTTAGSRSLTGDNTLAVAITRPLCKVGFRKQFRVVYNTRRSPGTSPRDKPERAAGKAVRCSRSIHPSACRSLTTSKNMRRDWVMESLYYCRHLQGRSDTSQSETCREHQICPPVRCGDLRGHVLSSATSATTAIASPQYQLKKRQSVVRRARRSSVVEIGTVDIGTLLSYGCRPQPG